MFFRRDERLISYRIIFALVLLDIWHFRDNLAAKYVTFGIFQPKVVGNRAGCLPLDCMSEYVVQMPNPEVFAMCYFLKLFQKLHFL